MKKFSIDVIENLTRTSSYTVEANTKEEALNRLKQDDLKADWVEYDDGSEQCHHCAGKFEYSEPVEVTQ